MFNKIKKMFKLSNWKRWAISSVSLVSILLAISLGSVYFLNNKPSIDYKSGAEVVLKITNLNEDPEIIKRQTQQRLNLTLSSDSSYKVVLNSDDFLVITATNIETDEEMTKFRNFVAPNNKESLKPTITTLNGKNIPDIMFDNAEMTGDSISLKIQNSNPYVGDILIWKNKNELETLAVEQFNNEWTSPAINRDPYKFLFIDGRTEDIDGGLKAILKTKDFGGFDAIDYLISKNNIPEGGIKGSISLDFAFAPKITNKQKEEIFYNLDFAVSSYDLNLQAYNFIKPTLGSNAYEFLIIAAATTFSFISVFLIVNYGLLGVLSTICAAFLIFLGLLMITVFRGEYTPENIAALLIAVGIGLDLNIVFFARIKKELKNGNSLQKSLKKADKLTLKSSVTKALALLITSIIIYIIGSLYLGTFSSLILIMTIFAIVIMFILIRILTNLIIGTKVFDDKLHLVGIYKKNSKKEIKIKNLSIEAKTNESLKLEEELILNNNLEFKNSKKIILTKRVSLIVLGIMAIVGTSLVTTFSFLGSNWLNGFNAGGSITNPTIFKTTNTINKDDVTKVKTILEENLKIDKNEINVLTVDKALGKYLLKVSTTKAVSDVEVVNINNLLFSYDIQLIDYSIMANQANNSILHIIYISLAVILAMTIFVLIRSDWTYALSIFIALFVALMLFIFLFTFQIFVFNIFFIFSLASAILITVSNNITILFRIKEKFKNKKLEELVKKDIKTLSDIAVRDSFKRLLISNGILIIILLIFTLFPGAMNISFTIPLIIFIFISLIVSTVIIPFLFIIFKTYRCKRKRNKILNNYWDIQVVQEQIFPGINDIK